ncbi:hypothetical protein VE03_10567 [Pseudogymnoascus sp. 23342-1-I1]|nr:hypothetical protein VE03_10567 [Pseudogymnoascus sp. 23342-1-I1]
MAMRAHVRVITIRVYFFSGYSQPRHINSNNFRENEEARQAVISRRKKLFEFDDDPLEGTLKTRTSQELGDDGVYVELQATSNPMDSIVPYLDFITHDADDFIITNH